VAGAEGIAVDVKLRQAVIGDYTLREGDVITIATLDWAYNGAPSREGEESQEGRRLRKEETPTAPADKTPKHPPSRAKCMGGGIGKPNPPRRRREPWREKHQEGTVLMQGFGLLRCRLSGEIKAL
jgi:hypothetical protein